MADTITSASSAEAASHPSSAIAWPAVIAGAFAAAAISLILAALGSGLGFATVSPWMHSPSLTRLSVMAAIWLIVIQWIASCAGGYLTGRMRMRWHGLHTDEVFFRDTANGFVAWAVATVATAALLTSAFASAAGGGAHAMAAGPAAPPPGGPMADVTGYYADSLLRTDRQGVMSTPASDRDMHAETNLILMHAMKNEGLQPDDKAYLTQLVASRTGLGQADAARRVDSVAGRFESVRQKAAQDIQQGKDAASILSFFTFFSLLIGAFIASVSAAIGGRHRDMF